MAVKFISAKEAIPESWDYNPTAQTEAGKWLDGNDVRCKKYLYRDKKRTVVHCTIEAGKFHGETVAASDYYYVVLLGRGELTIYHDHEDGTTTEEKIPLRPGDGFEIDRGTRYNYQAISQNLEVVLFMNNLWED